MIGFPLEYLIIPIKILFNIDIAGHVDITFQHLFSSVKVLEKIVGRYRSKEIRARRYDPVDRPVV